MQPRPDGRGRRRKNSQETGGIGNGIEVGVAIEAPVGIDASSVYRPSGPHAHASRRTRTSLSVLVRREPFTSTFTWIGERESWSVRGKTFDVKREASSMRMRMRLRWARVLRSTSHAPSLTFYLVPSTSHVNANANVARPTVYPEIPIPKRVRVRVRRARDLRAHEV